jgi:hypothetical protein
MAATITLHVWTGASAHTDGGAASEFNFGSADAADDTAAWRLSNPITIPAAGCAYSYEKYISACLGTAPNNSVGNFQIWGSPPTGSYATGTCWLIGVAACVNETADPVNTTSAIATSSLADATSGAKGTWDAASYAAAACETAYLVSQLQVYSTACVGNWGACDLNYSYDEL